MLNVCEMPNRTKPDAEKKSRPIVVNVPPPLKEQVDAMAASTGVSTSERVRRFLEAEVQKWQEES